MRRSTLAVLAAIVLFPAAGSANYLLPGDLYSGDLSSPETLPNSFQGYEVFDTCVYDSQQFGSTTYFHSDGSGYQISYGGDFSFGGFDGFRHIYPGSFCSAIPEPGAAVAFGLGALIVGSATLRRRSSPLGPTSEIRRPG